MPGYKRREPRPAPYTSSRGFGTCVNGELRSIDVSEMWGESPVQGYLFATTVPAGWGRLGVDGGPGIGARKLWLGLWRGNRSAATDPKDIPK